MRHFTVLTPSGEAVGQWSSAGGAQLYHKDLLGSVRAVADEAGTVVEARTYDAWGMALAGRGGVDAGSSTVRLGYTGHVRDAETTAIGAAGGYGGLDYFGARTYAPAFGRFVQADPLAEEMPSWSPFTYVLNNPLSVVDPDGRAPKPPDDYYLSRAGVTVIRTGRADRVYADDPSQGNNLRRLDMASSGDRQLLGSYMHANEDLTADLLSPRAGMSADAQSAYLISSMEKTGTAYVSAMATGASAVSVATGVGGGLVIARGLMTAHSASSVTSLTGTAARLGQVSGWSGLLSATLYEGAGNRSAATGAAVNAGLSAISGIAVPRAAARGFVPSGGMNGSLYRWAAGAPNSQGGQTVANSVYARRYANWMLITTGGAEATTRLQGH